MSILWVEHKNVYTFRHENHGNNAKLRYGESWRKSATLYVRRLCMFSSYKLKETSFCPHLLLAHQSEDSLCWMEGIHTEIKTNKKDSSCFWGKK